MSVWKTENPKEVKQYLVKYKAANQKIRVDVDWWHGDRWYLWGERVIKWAEIPEDEKENNDEAYKKGFKDGKQASVDAVGNLMVACGDGSTLEDANNIYYNEILADICLEIENKVKIGVMQNG